jgi:hypothetical protein
MIIVKNLNDAEHWQVYHISTGNTKSSQLSGTGTPDTSAVYWNNTSPTNSVFTIGNGDAVNNVNIPYIAYCFADVQGYSKFGSYVGNGNADGTFVYTGFKPAFVIAKTYTTTDDWRMVTQNVNTRNVTSNEIDKTLMAHTNAAESGTGVDFVSNGMKIRNTSGGINGSGRGFIYMAFAEQPLVGDNPATAR